MLSRISWVRLIALPLSALGYVRASLGKVWGWISAKTEPPDFAGLAPFSSIIHHGYSSTNVPPGNFIRVREMIAWLNCVHTCRKQLLAATASNQPWRLRSQTGLRSFTQPMGKSVNDEHVVIEKIVTKGS